ncbi:ABC transporter, permease protein [Shuttleworthella sp. MSX8B]|uniref:carbohydrate ABC transporter permease n=1 Tax=Shuttleworthella sp. MSX8B TaxID=936574 RepID=UPI00044D4FA4|nr:carbohydrate ABC transporter permease [Shuttleworthia sp. MSX8B]EUB15754.1 ABC transporter, permease protein [Shuttleworthia sp. MSX8B]
MKAIAVRRYRSRRVKERRFQIILELVMCLITFLAFVPIIVMLMTSFKSNVEIYNDFFALPKTLQWENYQNAFDVLATNMGGTLTVVAIAVLFTLALAAVGGYVFATMDFPGKGVLFFLFLALMMIPGSLYLTPNYMLIQKYHLFNTWGALILPWISGGQVLGIVLCRNAMEQIPRDLFEAAKMEGCGPIRCLIYIALPLAKPILSTVAIMQLVSYYNDFIWPMMVIESNRKQMITVAVRIFTSAQGTVNIGAMFAGYVIATLPIFILFMFTSRLYMEGLTAGAVKG